MRSRRPRSEHHEVVSRRLAELSDELEAARLAGAPAATVAPAAGGDWWSDHTRVSAVPLRAVPDPAPAPSPPQVPVPGRHAARRTTARLDGPIVGALGGGRTGLGPAHVAVVAVLVALGALVTAVLVVRADPGAPQATAPAAATVESSGPLVELPEPTPAPTSSAGAVTVDVAGRVRRPGIAVLDPGARVVDALDAAGGARPGVDLSTLNLARPLVDGEQILVGRDPTAAPPAAAAPPLPGAAGSVGAGGAVPSALVDLNTATASELDSLPEVGPVTAAAIIAWRDEHGGFSAVDELIEVDGIGEVTLSRIAPHATV